MTTLSVSNRQPLIKRISSERDPVVPPVVDSPGGDVVRSHPTLPDAVYRRAVQSAILREKAPVRARRTR